MHTSTLPSYWLEPPTRRTSPYVQLPLALTAANKSLSNYKKQCLSCLVVILSDCTYLNVLTGFFKLDLCTCSYTFTLTSNSSTFRMTVTTDSKAMWAVSEVTLTTTATNTVQVDWTNTITKVSISEGYCICCYDNTSYLKCAPAAVPQNIRTLSGVSQLSTHHSSIITSPGVIAHSAPQVTYTNLHSAFIWNISSCKSQLAICTWSWKFTSGVHLNWFAHDSNIKSHSNTSYYCKFIWLMNPSISEHIMNYI